MRPQRSTGSAVLDDVAEVIGSDAAMALAWRFFGLRLYIPKRPETLPELAEVLGQETAEKFCKVFAGTTLILPSQAVLEQRILTLHAEGKTQQQIARACRVTELRVYRVLRRHREADDRQMSLL